LSGRDEIPEDIKEKQQTQFCKELAERLMDVNAMIVVEIIGKPESGMSWVLFRKRI